MRVVNLALMAMVAAAGGAAAHECGGAGSAAVLRLEGWALTGKGEVALRYRVNEAKVVTRLEAHVYFEGAADAPLADAALTLESSAGVAESGSVSVTVSKDGARRLAGVEPGRVEVVACTNYLEYLDGSGMIID